MARWYISFARSKAEGGFIGATVVEASSAESALTVATLCDLNPGGEVAILMVPPEHYNAPNVLSMLNRLVGREEVIALGGVRLGDLLCSCCNPPRMH